MRKKPFKENFTSDDNVTIRGGTNEISFHGVSIDGKSATNWTSSNAKIFIRDGKFDVASRSDILAWFEVKE